MNWHTNSGYMMGCTRKQEVEIYTARFSTYQQIMKVGILVLDARTTVGVEILRPHKSLVFQCRNQGRGYDWMLEQYRLQLEESYEKDKKPWLEILNRKSLAVADEYGHEDERAHRMILRDFLISVAIRENIRPIIAGEIFTNNQKNHAPITAQWRLKPEVA